MGLGWRIFMLKIFTLAIFVVPVLCSAQNSTPMPDGPGKAIVQKSCVGCHSLKVVTSKQATHDEWASLVDQMVSKGADVSDDNLEAVVQYLAAHYGPTKDQKTEQVKPSKPAPVNVNTASAQDLERELALSDKEAESVVRYREQNGKFKSWQEVAAVPGVPSAKVEEQRDRLAF
jgi:competence ComEA-like helix-hairpin-helix protein